MSEPLTEAEGCALLTRLFEARGYRIARDVPFHEYGVGFDIDGWDAQARVGFEYLSSEAEDHDDLTLAEYETLTMAQRRGELFLFIIDETEPVSAAGLAEAANAFLDDVDDVRQRTAALRASSAPKAAPRLVPSSAAAPAKTPAASAAAKASPKAAAKKTAQKAAPKKAAKAANKPAKKKPAKKKAASKKPAKKKAAGKKPAKPAKKKPAKKR